LVQTMGLRRREGGKGHDDGGRRDRTSPPFYRIDKRRKGKTAEEISVRAEDAGGTALEYQRNRTKANKQFD